MFEPAWKKEDPKSEAKALKDMNRMSVSKLKQIALEAALDSVKYAAVLALGRNINDESISALNMISKESTSEHLQALCELIIRFGGEDIAAKDWFNVSDRTNSALYYNRINSTDVLNVMSELTSSINMALLFRSLFWSSDWKKTADEKVIETLHRIIDDFYDKGIPLSILLEWPCNFVNIV